MTQSLIASKVSSSRVGNSYVLAGRYRLIEPIGCGATSRVWRANDEMLDRDVAVKQFTERQHGAVREARITARVRHPHVVALHDLIQQGCSYWLVMDYHSGGTFTELIRDRRLPPTVVAGLGLQAQAALRATHSRGIVHGDVKPGNFLLDPDGRLVLIDFGVAESSCASPTHPARRNGDLVGTPAYMAPELLLGHAPRPAADLWSLGATLYAAVEGRPPFPCGDTPTLLNAILEGSPQPGHHAGSLGPLLSRLLEKDPALRPGHEQVQAALIQVCSGTPAGLVG